MKTSSRGTTAEDAGRKRAKTQAKDTSAPDGSNVTVPLLGTPATLLTKRAKLRNLKHQVEQQLRAVESALLMYSDLPIEQDKTPVYEYSEREKKAAHTLHTAGERTPWVDAGERAYQREKKRAERARKKAS